MSDKMNNKRQRSFACSSSEEIDRFRSGHNKYKTDFKLNTNQAIATNKC